MRIYSKNAYNYIAIQKNTIVISYFSFPRIYFPNSYKLLLSKVELQPLEIYLTSDILVFFIFISVRITLMDHFRFFVRFFSTVCFFMIIALAVM